MYILCQELDYKHKGFGRVGAINLEQLDTLLLSLKTYWDYSFTEHLLNISADVPQPEYEL